MAQQNECHVRKRPQNLKYEKLVIHDDDDDDEPSTPIMNTIELKCKDR
jgi:hypothetical protein